jgi:hypothetical protein
MWLQNVVKYGKYSPVKLANFEYFILRPGKCTIFEPKVVHFSARDTKILKIC